MDPFQRAVEALLAVQGYPASANEIARASDEVRAVLHAITYEDGTDEGDLIEVSARERVEAVSLVCAWNAMIENILSYDQHRPEAA